MHSPWLMEASRRAWWIVGREEVAELYGVYRTLEQSLGVRWFKPWQKDDPGEYVPRSAKVELPDAPRKQSPWFLQRHLDMTGSSVAHIPYSGMAWVYRAGLQTAALGGTMLAGPRPKKPGRDQARWDFFKPRVQINTLELGGGHLTFVSPIPPSEGNNYYQICVNTKGRMQMWAHPGGRRDPVDFGIVAAASVAADSYTVELKVPVAKMFPLVRGDVWRVLFCRNRRVTDEFTPRHGIAKNCCWTLDNGTHHRPADYRPMIIGERR